ncbi:MAG: SiaC family regulatory phosphoprotein [Bacteroidia bacterium]
MERATYANLIEFTKSLSVQDHPHPNELAKWTGSYFSDDDICRLFGRIIVERSKESQVVSPGIKGKEREAKILESKKLIEKLTPSQKFSLFVLYYIYCSDPNKGKLLPELAWHLNYAAIVLEVNKDDHSTLELFFSQTVPFDDGDKAVYFVNEKTNQLIKAGGINASFCLKKEEEIVYFKYFKNYDLFTSRQYHSYRPANTITRNITPKEVNIVSKSNYQKLFNSCDSYNKLVESVVSFFPLQTVRSEPHNNAPFIHLDAALGKIIRSGASSPLSPLNYFQPVYEWLRIYNQYGGEHLEVHLRFDYFNSYTSKFILNFTNMCVDLALAGKSIDFSWYYKSDDEETLDFGKHLVKVCTDIFAVKLVKDKSGVAV